MPRKQTRKTQIIRSYLLEGVRAGRSDLVTNSAELFGISRQSIHRHLAALVKEKFLSSSGKTSARVYTLGERRENIQQYQLDGLDESVIHRRDYSFIFDGIPTPIEEICHYGFTEMVNNAIDHSEGESVVVSVVRDESSIKIRVIDDGEGIFKRIARLLGLPDPRESLLELSKGKLTTDPKNHSGQGIFFTSRVFDSFIITSGELTFNHNDELDDDYLLHNERDNLGTYVSMSIALNSNKDLGAVFSMYSGGPDEYSFDRTVVPLRLALYEGEKLVSRSQAKRILNRVEKFRYVMLDFDGVDFIGQAFADEVFRVFAGRHRELELIPVNTTERVEQMISRAIASAMDFG